MILGEFFAKYSDTGLAPADQQRAKQAAAEAAASMIPPGSIVGLGTGSTVACLLERLASRPPQERPGPGVPSSRQTARKAEAYGLSLAGEDEPTLELRSDVYLDGADRVDQRGFMVKGGGGALLREKMVARYSRKVVIIVDPTKLVSLLGSDFPVPVELVPFGAERTVRTLGEVALCDGSPRLRRTDSGELFQTDNGNLIADCPYASISDPQALELELLGVPGVVEVGLFSGLIDTLVVGLPTGEAAVWERAQVGNPLDT